MPPIFCFDDQGSAISIPADQFAYCPAVYGVFIENSRVLLLHNSRTNLKQLPGRLLKPHETPGGVLRQHFQQATGIRPVSGPMLYAEELYRLDEKGKAWQVSALYYILSRPADSSANLTLSPNGLEPELMPLSGLSRNQLLFGYEAILAGSRAW